LPNNSVRNISQDIDGEIWLATPTDIVKWVDTTWTNFNKYNSDIPTEGIYDIRFKDKKNMYIGAGSGLYWKNDTTWTVFKRPNVSFSGTDCIIKIEFDKNGELWLIVGSGISHFNGTSWTHYTRQNSILPSMDIKCISFDKFNNAWIGTNSGLLIINENGIEGYADIKENIHTSFLLYPNPATDQLFISSETGLNASLEIFNPLGERVLLQSISGNSASINISSLKAGVYFVSLCSESGWVQQKFLKQ